MVKFKLQLACVAAGALAAAAALNAQPSSTLATVEQTWLTAHNSARAEFGSPPLRWSRSLTQEAREWARYLATRQQLRHSNRESRKGAGENLWMGTRGYFSPAQMVNSFVEERQFFVPGRFPQVSRTGNWGDVGHFTQIVWPQTREVGCAMASSAQYDVLVCRYWPAGNMIGTTITPHNRVAAK